MNCGTIVLIPFPFSELTQIKIRPAVAIAETKDKYKDFILAAISSQVPVNLSPDEIVVSPDAGNGLRVKSVIKVDRLFTLKQEKIIATLGTLTEKDINLLKQIFRSLAT